MLQLEVIETKSQGVFVREKKEYPDDRIKHYIINGEAPKPSFCKYWFVVSGVPTIIQQTVKQKDINYRYILIDPTMESKKIPMEFKREDVAVYNASEYYWEFKAEYRHLQSLYKSISDPQPDVLENVEFEIIANVKIDEVEEFKGFSFPTYRTRYKSDGEKTITQKDCRHQLLDRLVFPDILLPARPSMLSSKQTYDIIRKHILENINGKYAKVTSDYDFCFTVKKLIPLKEPLEYTVDVNLFTKKRKPKFVRRYQQDREVNIFEMTHSESNYKGYTPIKGFSGKDETELGENITNYLKDLMDYINEPLKDCPHCNGRGVIIEPMTKTEK